MTVWYVITGSGIKLTRCDIAVACSAGHGPEDCIIEHWCPVLGGRREPTSWRAPCPLCGTKRVIEFDVHGKSIRWNSFCGEPEHSKDKLRPTMRGLLGDCLPGKSGPAPIDHHDLIELALDKMPPTSLRLALLELAGMSTPDALDKLGVRREHRSRVISGRAPNLVQRRR